MPLCFFMIAQTRQFPTMSTMTSMECTVAMAIPDDWIDIMTESCRCYTVGALLDLMRRYGVMNS